MAETRRRTSSKHKQQYWQSHSNAYQESGLTQAVYCKQNKLNLKTFAYWRHRLKSDVTPIKFVQRPVVGGCRKFCVNGLDKEWVTFNSAQQAKSDNAVVAIYFTRVSLAEQFPISAR